MRRRDMRYPKTKLLFLVLFCLLAAPSSALASFGISTFTIAARNADGTIDFTAASHPFALDVHLAVNRLPSGEPDGALRTIQIDLPKGLIGDPSAIPSCAPADFDGLASHCEGATQVGVLRGVVTGVGQIKIPVYNLAPSPGYAAAFGGVVNGIPFVERMNLLGTGGGGSIRLTAVLPSAPAVVDVEEEIWGVPAAPGHDPERICAGADDKAAGGCAIGAEKPFLTLPASCAEPMRATLTTTSYGPPSATAVATAVSRDGGGSPQALLGCEAVPFEPRLTAATEATALVPTSLVIGLEVAQHEGAEAIGAAPVAGLELALPKGVALNPSVGSWLNGCSPGQIGLESAPGVEPPAFGEGKAECPAGARLGSVTLRTPLIDHELGGAIYLAAPFANSFDARYAIYLVIEDTATGTLLKIPARLDADPADGRLTATVPKLPPLPFEKLQLEFSGGPRAPLVDPPSCGRYSTEATFTPSTAPFRIPVTRTSSFAVSAGAWGAPCPPPETARNATPSFRAGTEATVAGGDSPLVIGLSRDDIDQHFGSFALTLPPGLVADLGSVSVGAAVGSVRVKAGLGPQPLALDGIVYLGGPYKGAPYSLEFVVPAKVGPFDLGTIVQRAAVTVDAETAQISVRSDPLPQILAGVPLELRALTVDLDRPGFVRNPTSCEPMAISGSATTSLGRSAPLSASFQVGECATLRFKPKLSLRLSGGLARGGHPGLRAVFRGDPDGAAPADMALTLPPGELLDLHHLRGLCPQDVAAERCPAGSRLGTLRLESPFLDGTAEGAVYLRVPSHRLPDLTAELHAGGLRFLLRGRTATSHGRLAIRFAPLPDIPLARAVLSLPGGRRGIFVNSRSLCARRPGIATATVIAHNGMRRKLRVRPRLGGHC